MSRISDFFYSCLEGEGQRQLRTGWHVTLGASLGEVAGAAFAAGPGGGKPGVHQEQFATVVILTTCPYVDAIYMGKLCICSMDFFNAFLLSLS